LVVSADVFFLTAPATESDAAAELQIFRPASRVRVITLGRVLTPSSRRPCPKHKPLNAPSGGSRRNSHTGAGTGKGFRSYGLVFKSVPALQAENVFSGIWEIWGSTPNGEVFVPAQFSRSRYRDTSRRCMTAKIIAVETPNMSIPSAASSGPSKLQDGDISTSPYPKVV